MYHALGGCSSRGFLEDRIKDMITGRAPPPARAESHLSKGSRELARPGPSLLVGSLKAKTSFEATYVELDSSTQRGEF